MTERLVPPVGRLDSVTLSPESPRPDDGGFLVTTEYAVTPTDQLTGVPSVLIPTLDLPPVPLNQKNVERVADWHHPFHPRSLLVNQTQGLAALRMVRKQWALYERHHDELPEGYHSIFGGPPLPSTEKEQFRTVIFAAAGYIPEMAIDFTADSKHRLKPLTDEQRLHLWQSGQIRIDHEVTVRDFIIDYILKTDFVDDGSVIVDEFLHTPNLERRIQIGNMLLRAASHESTTWLSPIYRKAKKEELIPPPRAHTVAQFVLTTTGLAQGRKHAYRALQDRFRAAA